MERSERPPRRRGPLWMALLGLLVAVGAAALVLVGMPVPAGLLTVVAGSAFVIGSLRPADPRGRFVGAVAERIGDAAILGAVAWASVDQDRWLAGAALAALGTAYVAWYLRAKAVGLGFRVEDSIGERGIRWVVLGAGITQGGPVLIGALWLAVLISLLALVREGTRAARQAEAR